MLGRGEVWASVGEQIRNICFFVFFAVGEVRGLAAAINWIELVVTGIL